MDVIRYPHHALSGLRGESAQLADGSASSDEIQRHARNGSLICQVPQRVLALTACRDHREHGWR